MINRVVIVGNLTKDIELKKTPTDKTVTSFTVAVNQKSGGQEITAFVPCVAWNQTAELLATYCQKGSQIGVEGRLSTRSYESGGKKVFVMEVIADSITFLGSKEKEPTPKAENQFLDVSDDELPF